MKLIGKRIEHFENLPSTHQYAKSLKDEEIEDGIVIVAENQTSGIGTHERKWIAEEGKNLTFNMILLPNCEVEKIKNLTILLAKCIVKTLDELYNVKVKIKEPNDVILNNRKLAGILTESISQGNIVKKIYIGIGINVNQENFDGELENIATSLKKEYKKDFSKEEILEKFLKVFENEYLKLLG